MMLSINALGPNFGSINIDKQASKYIKNALSTEQLKQVSSWKKELARTKFFDLNIKKALSKDELIIEFAHKSDLNKNSNAPLVALLVNDNTVIASATNKDNTQEPIYYNLKYPTPNHAREVYLTLQAYLASPKDVFNTISCAVESARALNSSYKYMFIKK